MNMKAQRQELVKAGKKNEKMLHTEEAVFKHKIGENLSHNMEQEERNPIQKEKPMLREASKKNHTSEN